MNKPTTEHFTSQKNNAKDSLASQQNRDWRSPVAISRYLAVASLLGLIVLGLGWELFWAPAGLGKVLLAVKILPLTLPLSGLLKNRMYTYRWTSLLVWIYFVEGIVRASEDTGLGALLAGGQTSLSLLLFAACAWHVRSRLGRAKAAATIT